MDAAWILVACCASFLSGVFVGFLIRDRWQERDRDVE